MIVAVIVFALAAIGLAIALRRATTQIVELRAEVARRQGLIDESTALLAETETQLGVLTKERDDALERAQRARRDAAQVAKRMQEEIEARAAAEATIVEERAEAERLARQLADVSDTVATGSEEDVAALWNLALQGVRRTWEISVAPSPGLVAPIDDAEDVLRAAVEIEVAAAREEAGAALELEWTGTATVPVAVSVRALSIIQALVARLAKIADEATLRIETSEVAVYLRVEAIDEAGEQIVPSDIAPEHQVEPGVYVLRMTQATTARSAS